MEKVSNNLLLVFGIMLIVFYGCVDESTSPANQISIFASWNQSFVLKNGKVWVFGNNYYGQLGDGTNENKSKPVIAHQDYITISPGFFHTLGLKKDGTLWSWAIIPLDSWVMKPPLISRALSRLARVIHSSQREIIILWD